ncbi:MAG: hypothetical protein ACRDWD_09925 [Acidimicrobiia bacterium]
MTQRGESRVAVPRLLCFMAVMLLVFVSTIGVAAAQDEGDPSKVGDLTGNLPLAVYLLIPLALVLALLTAVALGPRGDPAASLRRTGGVARVLTEREDSAEKT